MACSAVQSVRVARRGCRDCSCWLQVTVRAVGLNFRDVLNVLGMYPGDPGPPGSDCAGVVEAVGPGVSLLAPGEARFQVVRDSVPGSTISTAFALTLSLPCHVPQATQCLAWRLDAWGTACTPQQACWPLCHAASALRQPPPPPPCTSRCSLRSNRAVTWALAPACWCTLGRVVWDSQPSKWPTPLAVRWSLLLARRPSVAPCAAWAWLPLPTPDLLGSQTPRRQQRLVAAWTC